jgi:hypothetical protein
MRATASGAWASPTRSPRTPSAPRRAARRLPLPSAAYCGRTAGAPPPTGPRATSRCPTGLRCVACGDGAPRVNCTLASGSVKRQCGPRGDVLELLFRGRADRVECSGGIQLPMWRVGRSDIWELSVRIARLDHALVSLVPHPLCDSDQRFGSPLRLEPLTFRGAHASLAPPALEDDAGLVRAELEGPGMGGPRAVCAWRPPSTRGRLPVIYCADALAAAMARTVGAAIASGSLDPVLLVGIESGGLAGSVDRRAQEYLPGWSRRRFAAHERFVLERVLPWAERTHGASRDPGRRFTLGCSNGAAWALAMAQRHPSTFRGAAAFSVAGDHPIRARHHANQRYALCAGTLEPGFARRTAAWAAALGRDPQTTVAHRERVAGHDFQLWLEEAPWALGALLG